MEKITVIGAGLVGSILSAYLARQGYEVSVFDKRPDPTLHGALGGRSINLALSYRGWKAIDELGLRKSIEDISIPMKGRSIHQLNGQIDFQPYGTENEALYSVSRGMLNKILVEEVKKGENIKCYFNHECTGLDYRTNEISFNTLEGNLTIAANRIFAADGANSAVRESLSKDGIFNAVYEPLSHGYKELLIPAGNNGKHKIEKNALHIWPRGGNMLIALPNFDGSFTSTIFLPHEGDYEEEYNFSSLENNGIGIIGMFQDLFSDAIGIMPDFVKSYGPNEKESTLGTHYCNPWNFEDKVLLIGDSAHGVVPFYGQGMNAGFQDCIYLNNLINNHKGDWKTIFSTFSEKRKPDLDALANLSLYNFIEMRDKVSDNKFLLQKDIERYVSSEHPGKWTDLHYLVTFTDVPYSKAKEIGDLQSRIMESVMSEPDVDVKWKNWAGFRSNITKKILNSLEDSNQK